LFKLGGVFTEKYVLMQEKETLLIPLLGKAKENEKEKPVLIDKKAAEIVNQIDYDFESLKVPEKTNIMMCMRAKLIDNFVRNFFTGGKEGAALHLGCGLDSRYDRIGNDSIDWYDVDFKEVIDIRRHFYSETDNYRMIATSVTYPDWIEKIPSGEKHYIVIAEGLFMYLKEDEIKKLINRLKERIGSYTLIFDAFSVTAAKRIKDHPSLKKTGAMVHWGINNPEELVKWGLGIQFIEEMYFTDNVEIRKLNTGTRLVFKLANLFKTAKTAHRVLVCRIGCQ